MFWEDEITSMDLFIIGYFILQIKVEMIGMGDQPY